MGDFGWKVISNPRLYRRIVFPKGAQELRRERGREGGRSQSKGRLNTTQITGLNFW